MTVCPSPSVSPLSWLDFTGSLLAHRVPGKTTTTFLAENKLNK